MENKNVLNNRPELDMMSLTDIAELYAMRKKESEVSKFVDLTKIKRRNDKDIFYVYVDRKSFSASTRDKLIDKLHVEFCQPKENLNSFYPTWEHYRKNYTAVTPKTVRENWGLYKSKVLDDPIAEKPLQKLKPIDFVEYFERLTKDRTITKQVFTDTKSILNGLLNYAVRKEIIATSPLNSVDYRHLPFKAVNSKIIPYNETERLAIIDYFKNSTHLVELAIAFDFYFTLRIGEVKGLRWSDIDGDYINIQRFINDDNEVVDHIKGNADEGYRSLFITKDAHAILENIKALHSDPEYIFSGTDEISQRRLSTDICFKLVQIYKLNIVHLRISAFQQRQFFLKMEFPRLNYKKC